MILDVNNAILLSLFITSVFMSLIYSFDRRSNTIILLSITNVVLLSILISYNMDTVEIEKINKKVDAINTLVEV